MPKLNPRYLRSDTAAAYQYKIETKRKLSGWLESRMLERALNDVVGDRILDCPCGTGRIDPLLRARFPDITGVDGAAAMLEVYREGNPERRGRVADVFDLPFAGNEFDWTVCHRLFHHFNTDGERVDLLNALARVSRYGVTLYCWLDVPLSRRGKRPGRGRQSISRSHLERLLEDTPLEAVRIYHAFWPFTPKAVVTCTKAGQ